MAVIILDAWSRKVAGYDIGRSIAVRLTLAALCSTIEKRNRCPAAGITPIADRNMLRGATGKLLPNMAASNGWAQR